MKIQFTVHSVTQGPTSVPVMFQGKEILGATDSVQVELTSDDPQHGSLNLRFVGDQRAEAADLFTPDRKIEVSFA